MYKKYNSVTIEQMTKEFKTSTTTTSKLINNYTKAN